MADFLASLAKNYKGDPFGAGMGLYEAREVTDYDAEKERDYYLGGDKEASMLIENLPDPTQVGKYENAGQILAAIKKLNDYKKQVNAGNYPGSGMDTFGVVRKSMLKNADDKLQLFNAQYEKFAGGGGNDRFDQDNMDEVIKTEVTDKIVEAKQDDATDEEVVEEVTLKQRMANLFNDADKRDAILGGIADAMLETRVGADAYGNRFARAQKNVRDNLKLAEATDIARQQAQLDAMKTLAETDKLTNPAQYLSSSQKEAKDIVMAQIAAGQINQEDYAKAYARTLKQITVKDLTSAKASSIKELFAYAQALQSTDPDTAALLMDAIKANAIYLAGDSGNIEDISTTIDATNL